MFIQTVFRNNPDELHGCVWQAAHGSVDNDRIYKPAEWLLLETFEFAAFWLEQAGETAR